jgi:hypothetical protein
MTTIEWISMTGVVVQVLLFAGLIWYCVETRGIRRASQAQVEATHAPCLTFHATPREAVEAILGMDDARGAMILDFDTGDAVLKNIGNGPAVNISYVLTPKDIGGGPRLDGYVAFVPNGARCTVPISRNILVNRHYDCVIQYESLSQTRYATRLTIGRLVLTPPFKFGKLS